MTKDPVVLRPVGSVTTKVIVQAPSAFGAMNVAFATDGVVSFPAVTTLPVTVPQVVLQLNVSCAVCPASGSWAKTFSWTESP